MQPVIVDLTRDEIERAIHSDWSRKHKAGYYSSDGGGKSPARISIDAVSSNFSQLAVVRYFRSLGYKCETDLSTYETVSSDQWDKDVCCETNVRIKRGGLIKVAGKNLIVKGQLVSMRKFLNEQCPEIINMMSWVFQRKYGRRSADPLLTHPGDPKVFCGVLIKNGYCRSSEDYLQLSTLRCAIWNYWWPDVAGLVNESDPEAEPWKKELVGQKKVLYFHRIEHCGIQQVEICRNSQ